MMVVQSNNLAICDTHKEAIEMRREIRSKGNDCSQIYVQLHGQYKGKYYFMYKPNLEKILTIG